MAATMVAMTAKTKNCALSSEKKNMWAVPELRFPWDSSPQEDKSCSLSLHDGFLSPAHGGLFASVSLKVSAAAPAVAATGPAEQEFKIPFADHCMKYVSSAVGFPVVGTTVAESVGEEVVDGKARKKAGRRGLKLKIKIGNPHLRRLALSVSRPRVGEL